jgi:hypothetical protein
LAGIATQGQRACLIDQVRELACVAGGKRNLHALGCEQASKGGAQPLSRTNN